MLKKKLSRGTNFRVQLCMFSLFALLCIVLLYQGADCHAATKAEKAYKKFISKEKESRQKKNLYGAIIKASKDKSQILLIAEDVFSDDKLAVDVDIYHYVKGKVVYIGHMTSNSTAYPIATYNGKYLVSGSHHALQRALVSGKSASVKEVTGIYLDEDEKCYVNTYKLTKNKVSDQKSRVVTRKAAENYSEKIYGAWKQIKFKKY